MSRPNTLKLLNKLTVSELAELSKLSKAYISQVRHSKRSPIKKLILTLKMKVCPEKGLYAKRRLQ